MTTLTDPDELALLRSLYHSAAEGTDDGGGGIASNASSSSSESEAADDDVQVGIYFESAG